MELHYLQLEILKELLFQPQTTFTHLVTSEVGTNMLSYHLKKLISLDLVSKEGKFYKLTHKGKEYASTIDTWEDRPVIHKQGKNRAACFIFSGKIGESQVVLQTRLKEPFWGYEGFPCEKIQFGETALEAAQRCFYRETGLKGELSYAGTCHKVITFQGNTLEDSYFFVFVTEDAKGELTKKLPGLENTWFDPDKYTTLEKTYAGTDVILKNVLEKKQNFWLENFFEVKQF